VRAFRISSHTEAADKSGLASRGGLRQSGAHVEGGGELLGCELLGVNWKVTAEAHAALRVLREAHADDERTQGLFSAMITLPSWSLSLVRPLALMCLCLDPCSVYHSFPREPVCSAAV
jgi:hypothetical protein